MSCDRRLVGCTAQQAGEDTKRRLQYEECCQGRYEPIPSFHHRHPSARLGRYYTLRPVGPIT